MASNNYSEEQKAAVLARVPEIGVRAAAEEAGIPWQAVARWNKVAKEAQETDNKVESETSEAVVEVEVKPAEEPIPEAEADVKPAEASVVEADASPVEADDNAKPVEKKPAKAKAQSKPKQKKSEKESSKTKQAAKKADKKTVETEKTVNAEDEKSTDSAARFPVIKPFMVNRGWFKNNRNSKSEFTGNMKTYAERMIDMQKSSVENVKQQWSQSFSYLQDLQGKFVDFLPDDSKFPIPSKKFVNEMKKLQEKTNQLFEEQMDSIVDFFIKGQEQFFDMVYKATEKKEEE